MLGGGPSTTSPAAGARLLCYTGESVEDVCLPDVPFYRGALYYTPGAMGCNSVSCLPIGIVFCFLFISGPSGSCIAGHCSFLSLFRSGWA